MQCGIPLYGEALLKTQEMTAKNIQKIKSELRRIELQILTAELLVYSPVLRKQFAARLDSLNSIKKQLKEDLTEAIHEKLTK